MAATSSPASSVVSLPGQVGKDDSATVFAAATRTRLLERHLDVLELILQS